MKFYYVKKQNIFKLNQNMNDKSIHYPRRKLAFKLTNVVTSNIMINDITTPPPLLFYFTFCGMSI